MSTATIPYFHSANLRQRYADEVDDAQQNGRLSPRECTWLQALIRLRAVDDPDPVRVDRLTVSNPAYQHAELVGALMLSHAATEALEVYLYTPGLGVEVFADRTRLLATLRARYVKDGSEAIFESEKVEGDPFIAQMLAIVDHQAEQVRELTLQLKRTPTLSSVEQSAVSPPPTELSRRYAERLSAFWSDAEPTPRREVAVRAFENSVRNQIYQREADRLLTVESRRALCALMALLPGQPTVDSPLRCYRLAIMVGNSPSCPLAGTFVVKPAAGLEGPLLWFSPDHEWLSFEDTAGLTAHFASPQGRVQLAHGMALADHSVLQREGVIQVGFADIPVAPCAALVDSIIALQARNMAYAVNLPQSPDSRPLMIDDALDIRGLLDPRQWACSVGRWRREAPFDFSATWLQPPPANPEATPAVSPPTPGEVSAPSWRELTLDFDQRAQDLRQLENALVGHAEQQLRYYLCVWSRALPAPGQIRVQWLASPLTAASDPSVRTVVVSETHQAVSIDLTSLLLECVSGCRPLTLPATALVHPDGSTGAGRLPAILIDHIVARLTPNFVEGYVDHFERSRLDRQRQGDRQGCPDQQAMALRADAMRLYAALATRQHWIGEPGAELIRQLLDQPLRAARLASSPTGVEAYQVWLTYGNGSSALLCDTLVLQQPLVPERPLQWWSGITGWRPFASIERLEHKLQRTFGGADRGTWLELLSDTDRLLLERHLDRSPKGSIRVRLERIDGHALETLQRSVLQRGRENVRHLCQRALRCRFTAQLFTELAAQCEIDHSLNTLIDGLSVKIETCLFEALLPPWLSGASITDLGLYCDFLKRYYEASDGGKDFLYGVSSLHGYARKQLVAQLNVDFAGQGLNPDEITVTSREFVTAFPPSGELPSAVPAATAIHTESLTEYVINRFASHQGAVLSVTSEAYPTLATTMTPDYLRQLARRLNIGAGYVSLLRQALAPTDALYETRNRLFVEQLPPMLLAVALAQKLKGELSAAAFDLVFGVLEMPDGVAREPINGVRALIAPLDLVADTGMSPDPVTGVYMIGGGDMSTGPVVVYAIHHSAFTFREFSSQAELLAALRSDVMLQQLLLERVEPEVHRRYAHGGFVEPHLPFSVEGLGDVPLRAPGPVTLAVNEVKGNALQYLFMGTVKLLLDLGVSNSVTNEQEDQAGRTFLATLGFEQVVSLLPSKLAALVTLWQSQTLLRASATSASGRHWGEAFSEFSAALGVMVTAREQSLQEQLHDDQVGAGSDNITEEEETPPSVFSWRGATLDAEQRQRLQGLEARNVALSDMRHDKLLNLYVDDEGEATYAIVSGRVYQVRLIEEESTWIIIGADGATGPKLVLDINQRWHLDLTLRLRGGGGGLGKLKEGKIDRSAKDIMVIEAKGMPEIRRLYRDRAWRIGQAHLHAKRFLETCLDNLSPVQKGQPLDPRATRIIAEFFGVSQPDQGLLNDTLNAARSLYSALMDASLSPFSSPRFVVGSTRPGHDTVTAFVIKADPQQRVYLTEQFFMSPGFAVRPDAIARGFSADVHHRAANLIHELSHLALDTHDIAYLESMAPFPDVLLDDTPQNLRVRDNVALLHETRLSHRSHRDDLFTMVDAGKRRDIEPQDGRGFETILKVTRSQDLDDARDMFLADEQIRSELMLRNADSVTLLMLLLGRENFVVPSP